MFPPTRTMLHTSRESSSSSSSSFWGLIWNGGMIQRIQSISSTYLQKGIKICHPSDLYVDDNKNMNLSCWGIKIRHPLWLRWQGSLHQLILLRDQKLAPPLTYMWCNIWYLCYVLLYASATSDSDAEQRRGCSEHVKTGQKEQDKRDFWISGCMDMYGHVFMNWEREPMWSMLVCGLG